MTEIIKLGFELIGVSCVVVCFMVVIFGGKISIEIRGRQGRL